MRLVSGNDLKTFLLHKTGFLLRFPIFPVGFIWHCKDFVIKTFIDFKHSFVGYFKDFAIFAFQLESGHFLMSVCEGSRCESGTVPATVKPFIYLPIMVTSVRREGRQGSGQVRKPA